MFILLPSLVVKLDDVMVAGNTLFELLNLYFDAAEKGSDEGNTSKPPLLVPLYVWNPSPLEPLTTPTQY